MEHARVSMSSKSSTNGVVNPNALDDPSLFGQTLPPQEAGPDPFDPDSLRLAQDFSASLGVKKALLTVPVRKPAKEWFIRVHPSPAYRVQTAVIELKEEREVYLVAPALWPVLAGESTFTAKMLCTAINRQGVLFLWPIRLPDRGGRADPWSKSAVEGAEVAIKTWVRIQPDQHLGAYSILYTDQLPDPDWPDIRFADLLRIAFKDRFIDTLDHPVLRQLRGEG